MKKKKIQSVEPDNSCFSLREEHKTFNYSAKEK